MLCAARFISLGMLGYSFHFYCKNTGMSYIMLSELPGELEAGTWWGENVYIRRSYASNRKPPCRPTEGPPASLKHPHQQIWSAATDRLGHNSQGAYFNQRHASFLWSAQSWILVCMKGNTLAVAEAPWDSAETEDWSDTHATDDVCSAGMVDIDCYLLNRGLQLDSTHVNDFNLAQIVRKGSTTRSSLTESPVQWFILDFINSKPHWPQFLHHKVWHGTHHNH